MNQYLIFLFAPTVLMVVAIALVWLVTRGKRPTPYTDADEDKIFEEKT